MPVDDTAALDDRPDVIERGDIRRSAPLVPVRAAANVEPAQNTAVSTWIDRTIMSTHCTAYLPIADGLDIHYV